MRTKLVVHRGGCHCGNIRFEVTAPADIRVSSCNCSICSKSGYLGLIVRLDRFKLKPDAKSLTTYRFNTGNARHIFCPICGIKSYYHPRSHPGGISVNARCLDPETVATITEIKVDGANWEENFTDGSDGPYLNEPD
jgi:hypothetical protein